MMYIVKIYLIVFAIDAVLIAIYMVNVRRQERKRFRQFINDILNNTK